MNEDIEVFPKFPKIPRRRRPITITEKIDGTNGLISIGFAPSPHWAGPGTFQYNVPRPDDSVLSSLIIIRAGSKNRWLTPAKSDDNFGFARWVWENRWNLVADLGIGDHYGEWYGNGIQRGYELKNGDKRFALFNTYRWSDRQFATSGLGCVPIICKEVDNHEDNIQYALRLLEKSGSFCVPGFMKPEGIVIFEHASDRMSKVTLENDNEPKGKKSILTKDAT